MIKKYIYFLVLITFQSFSQSIHTQFYTANSGLLSNNVSKVFIDSKGSLWLGSRAGLAKKTVNGFEKVNQALQYKFNNIYDITEDYQQGMWIAGYGQGLLYFDKKQSRLFQEKDGLASNIVRSIKNYGNRIYVGTLSGLSIINLNDFSIINPSFTKHPQYDFTVTSTFQFQNKIFATTLNDGIYEVTDKQLIKVSDIKKVFSTFVYQNQLFVGTEKELLVLDPKTLNTIKTYSIPSVWEYVVVNKQLYFVSSGIFETKGGIFALKNDQVFNVSKRFEIPFYDLKSLAYHPNFSFFYVGSFDNGLVQIHTNSPIEKIPEMGETYTITSHGSIEYMFHKQGLSLVSNQKIVKHISNSSFKDFQLKNESRFKKIAVKENHFYPIDYSTTAENIQYYQTKGHNDEIWVASNLGMFVLSLQGEIKHYYPVHVFCFDFFKDQLITPVPYGGVRIFEDIHSMRYTYHQEYEQPNIPADIVDMVVTNDGVYFASALSGLYEYRNGVFQSFLHNKTFKEAKIKRIALSSKGNLFVVTDFNDVYELSVASTPIKVVRKIAYDQVRGTSTSFVKANKGFLYIGTNEGINVFTASKYYFIDKDQGLKSYNNQSGVIVNDKLLIAGKDGVFSLQTNYFNERKPIEPKIELQKVLVNNKEWIEKEFYDKRLVFDNSENQLTFIYELLGMQFPEKVEVFYRLKKSLQWEKSSTTSRIQLNYLESGDYDVQLKVLDHDQGEEYLIDLAAIKILPPFYLQWPFILGSIMFLSFGMVIIYQRKLKDQQKKQEVVQKQLEYEKQLSEVKLQALKSQMNSHFLFNVLSSIQYFILTKDIDNALYYLERFSNLIRTTLDFSDKKSVSLYEEIAYLEKYVEIENLRTEHDVVLKQSIHSSINLSEIQIVPLLLQPFIENAMVHAFPPTIEQPEITITIEPVAEGIQIEIADNGVGYVSKSKKHESKGISIVQKRLELTQKNLKKELMISSNDQGTKVVLVIDGTKIIE